MPANNKKSSSAYSLSSIIQLSILVFGLILAVFLTDQAQKYIGRAGTSPTPKNVLISNLTENSFTVSWVTDKPSTGAIILKPTLTSPSQTDQIFFDDRSSTYTTNSLFSTHFVSLRNLTPGVTYSFLIQSGNEKFNAVNTGKPYEISTLKVLTTPPLAPKFIYGSITDKLKNPAPGVIVSITSANLALLSSLSDQNGNFILSLAGRSTEGNNYYAPTIGEVLTLNLDAGELGSLKKDISYSGVDQNLKPIALTGTLSNSNSLTDNQGNVTVNNEGQKLNFFEKIILFIKNLFNLK